MGNPPSFPVVDIRGRKAIVTGANTGIGYEAASHLAMMGASVVIACRSEQRARDAITQMKERVPEYQEKGYIVTSPDDLDVEFMALDLGSLQSVMEFIEAYRNSGRELHLLLCNAGLGLGPRVITEDGFEQNFQVNYLGHFLLVAHLLAVLRRSGEDCRIIFTSSTAHRAASFNLDTAQAPPSASFNRMEYYGNSKLYQIQHMFCLARRLKGSNISVTSMHPGAVRSGFTRSLTDKSCLACIMRCIMSTGGRTPFEGAVTLIDLAVNPRHREVSNLYMADCKRATPSSTARNKEYQEKLWQYSLDCLKNYLPSDVITSLGTPQS